MNDEKIAIVGMEAIFGADEGLDAFDRTVFDGVHHSAKLPPDRQQKIRSGRKPECKEAYIRLLKGMDRPCASRLLRRVAEGALGDTLSRAGEDTWRDLGLIIVSDRTPHDFQPGAKRFLQEDCLFRALQTAQSLFAAQEVKSVIIGAVHLTDRSHEPSPIHLGHQDNNVKKTPASEKFSNGLFVGEGAAALFLKEVEHARHDRDRIYAMIDAVVVHPHSPSSGSRSSCRQVADICRTAFDIAGVQPREMGYVEVVGKGSDTEDPTEINGLALAYRTEIEELTCALGTTEPSVTHTSPLSPFASLMKTALCLYHRYIPSGRGWIGPKDETLWERSPFYVVTESRPWFVNPGCPRRRAAISSVASGRVAHLVLSEDTLQRPRPNRYLAMVAPYCYPLAGDHQTDFINALKVLYRTTKESLNLLRSAKQSLVLFQECGRAEYALMIVGHTREEILREIEFMQQRLPDAFEKGVELKTPKGSYFTSHPLGGDETVAFLYPGVGSAYVGLGQELFHLFPELHDRALEMTPDVAELFKEREIYPRSRDPLTEDEKWRLELRLRGDLTTIAKCGLSFFWVYTMVLRDYFKITPHYAFGYSQGETGMMTSLGVWADPLELTEKHMTYPTFRERLHGELTAVREYWGLDEERASSDDDIWNSYTLRAAPSVVQEALEEEERVFLTMVNTQEEVVIAGDPASCSRVIKKLGCKYYPLGLRLALHADPAQLEYDRLVDLYTLPINQKSGIKLYSTSCYKSIPIRTKAIAHSIAKAFCNTVDFPRLVNQVYEDGARIFIEIGSRKYCSNLIDKILEDKPHLAIPTNVKGVKDQASLVRIAAQLVSHRVPLDLSPLF